MARSSHPDGRGETGALPVERKRRCVTGEEDVESLLAAGTLGLHRADISLPSVEITDRPTLQRVMTGHGAIGRDRTGLTAITHTLDGTVTVRQVRTRVDIEDAALAVTARVFVVAALAREETRGCHVRVGHPIIDDVRSRRSLFLRLDHDHRPILVDAPQRRHAA